MHVRDKEILSLHSTAEKKKTSSSFQTLQTISTSFLHRATDDRTSDEVLTFPKLAIEEKETDIYLERERCTYIYIERAQEIRVREIDKERKIKGY